MRTLDDRIALWIDVGEPAFERIKKATRIASAVKVYSFNAKSKSDAWWQKGAEKFQDLNVAVIQFDWSGVQALARLVQRTMNFSVMITGESTYVSTEQGECEVSWTPLQLAAARNHYS
jgi:uncharacterized protein YaeQ